VSTTVGGNPSGLAPMPNMPPLRSIEAEEPHIEDLAELVGLGGEWCCVVSESGSQDSEAGTMPISATPMVE
jgi:hypothetical protein